MQIKLITIDFWNTLFDSSNGEKRNEYRIGELKFEMAKAGLNISDSELSEVMSLSWEHFNRIWKQEQRTPGLKETQDFFRAQLRFPNDNETADRLSHCFAESILYFPPKPVEGVVEAIQILSNNYLLAIVSDTGFSPGKVLKRLMHEFDMLNYFSSFSFSDETGVAKPHPKAFKVIFDELDVMPNEALHIGDIEDTDIIGAKNIGMRAIRFTGDPTAFLNLNNSKDTAADYESENWMDIVNYINNLNGAA